MRFPICITAFAAVTTLHIAPAGAATEAADSSASECCVSLESALPGKTFSSTNQAQQYQRAVLNYFSVQDRLSPNCFVLPTSTKDVSKIVGLLSQKSCRFAIKSGGHGLPVGASNIDEGVTIDLGRMKDVTLSADQTTAAVQAGAKWGDVYNTLDAQGYAIPGGRAASVGVGGLTTGGGNSFFSARYGFVCDNVKNFEVVLGNGTVVQANNQTNADLFTALKGSSNNLGIVTRFDFVAFKQGNLWGGTATYDGKRARTHIEAFVKFTNDLVKYPESSLIFVWSYIKAIDAITFTNLYEYTGDVEGLSATQYPSPAFDVFAPTSPVGAPTSDTLRIANLSSLTKELESPPELSNLYASITFSNNLTVINGVADIIKEELDEYKKQDFFVYISFQIQPLPRVFIDRGLDRGPNVLGLDRNQDNNVFFLFDLAWNGTQYDEKNRQVARKVIGRLQEYTKSMGALKEFQYLNYAFRDLDPIGGYGPDNIKKIKDASAKYDPLGVFQKLVPGGFKLADAGEKAPLPGSV
ncbi:MAG: hypothetical protein LQ345_006868 [Seirophora villosa]|nr:MAG: hypothetical protein LQ345_006868 [Seirophora villosa]